MDVTVGSDQERRYAEQWFRRRGLPAVVRGRPRQIVVRTLPAVVGLTLSNLMVDVLEAIDGDGEFETRVDNTGFFLLYSAARRW